MSKFIQELKRRNVIKATISYVVFSYALLQIASLLVGILELDKGVSKIVLIVLIIALPFWIVFAYIYEWTPSGFQKTDSVEEDKSIHQTTSKKLNHYIIAGLFLLILLLVADRVFDFTGNMVKQQDSIQVIAVLPFIGEGQDEEEEFFSSGIQNDVMTRLSNIDDFRIIARSAVAQYKDYEGDLKTIGDRFDANYILQATVRRNGEQVRVTATLTNAKNNQTAWSNVYDGELADVFELQSDIATKIASQLEANLSPEEKKDLKAIPTENVSAYEDYLLARYTVTKPNAGYNEFNQGVRILERAVATDPNFTSAWTLLVEIHSILYDILKADPNNKEGAEKAKEATYEAFKVAQKLAPGNSDVLAAQAFILKNIEQDPLGALSAFEKAIEQNPSDFISLKEAAFLYTFFDQPLKSKSALEKAFALTQDNGPISFQLTFAYEVLGEYEKMVPVLEKLAKYYPEEKHYAVEAKYYQFLNDGKLSSFNDFKASIENTTTEFPWDERAVKNKEMVVAMFNDEFEKYHDKWEGHMASHTANGHDGWVCPMVANDNLNQARLMLSMGDPADGEQMLKEVEEIVLRPINLYSVCTFNPDIYLPKLDFLKGETQLAKQKLDEVAFDVIQNKSFPTGAVERAILVQAADLIDPEKVYTYFKQVSNAVSFISFEAVCADPWTFPNLIKDARFQEEIKKDGRFVEFLSAFGFLKS